MSIEVVDNAGHFQILVGDREKSWPGVATAFIALILASGCGHRPVSSNLSDDYLVFGEHAIRLRSCNRQTASATLSEDQCWRLSEHDVAMLVFKADSGIVGECAEALSGECYGRVERDGTKRVLCDFADPMGGLDPVSPDLLSHRCFLRASMDAREPSSFSLVLISELREVDVTAVNAGDYSDSCESICCH